jgi:predicted DNA-binding transcriptional regulator AlpA
MGDADRPNLFRSAFRKRPTEQAQPDRPSAIRSSKHRTWTPDEVRALGMTTDLETAAAIIGIGRTLAYDLVGTGNFPVRVLRLGRRVVVPIADLLTYLGEAPG